MKSKNIVSKLVLMNFQSMIYSLLSFLSGKTSTASAKKSVVKIILFALMGIFVLVMLFFFTVMFLIFGYMVGSDENTVWLYPTISIFASFGFSMMGSVLASQSYLFESHDNELLMSMPIKPIAILLSRFVTFFSLNSIYSLMISLPSLVAYSLIIKFNFLGLIAFLIAMFFTPLLSTALCSVIGYFIWIVTSKTPNKKLITTLIGFVISTTIIILGTNAKSIGNLILNNQEFANRFFSRYFTLFYWFGKSVINGNFLYSLPLIVFSIILTILSFLLISVKFSTILCTKPATYKKKYITKPMKVKNPMVSLIRKELGYFFSIPSYVLNGAFGTIAAIIMGIYMLVNPGGFDLTVDESLDFLNVKSLTPFALLLSVTLFSAMNDITAPTISLEAKTLWIIKTMPIDCMDILIAKSLMSLIITLPGTLFLTICATFTFSLNIIDILFLIIVPSVAALFAGFLGVCVNLYFPRFDWSSEIIIIKQSGSVFIALFASIILSMVPVIISSAIAILVPSIPILLLYIFCTLYFVIFVIIEFLFLKKKGPELFDKLS